MAHLDGEVVVPPALDVVGVLRAAAAAPVLASAVAPTATVPVARRVGAGHGACWGGRRGQVMLAWWERWCQ
jgi:hypothetical protein